DGRTLGPAGAPARAASEGEAWWRESERKLSDLQAPRSGRLSGHERFGHQPGEGKLDLRVIVGVDVEDQDPAHPIRPDQDQPLPPRWELLAVEGRGAQRMVPEADLCGREGHQAEAADPSPGRRRARGDRPGTPGPELFGIDRRL